MTKSFERNLRILVTDGHHPAALCVIRAFGRAGHQVIAAHVAGDRPPLCLSSRHCSGSRIQPDARRHPARFFAWLADRVRADGLQAIVPTSAAAIAACTHFRSELRHRFPALGHRQWITLRGVRLDRLRRKRGSPGAENMDTARGRGVVGVRQRGGVGD
jgi:hypothetical protein